MPISFAYLLLLSQLIGQVVAVQCRSVKPRSGDVHESCDATRTTFALNEEAMKSGQALEAIIEELDQFSKGKLHSESGRSFHVITDGQLHLRQVLHPEACTKCITLPAYFSTFYDLRKEFKKFYRNLSINSIQDMTNYLCMEPDASADSAIQKVQDMAKIIIRLINDGQSRPRRDHNSFCHFTLSLSLSSPLSGSLTSLYVRRPYIIFLFILVVRMRE